MATRSAALCLTLGLAVFVALPDRAAAQAAVPATQSETQLLGQIAQQPRAISGYLDLARLYFEQRRYDEALRMLSRAMAVIDQQKLLAGPPQVQVPVVPTPGTAAAPPPPAAAGTGAPPRAPVRVGGDIREPRKIKHVPPVYPDAARAAGVQGLVILEAIIDRDGNVRDVSVLRSVPQLDQAAIDAVRQWQFTPTLLNTVPVEVIMTVTVNFSLAGPGAPAAAASVNEPIRVGVRGTTEPKKITHVNPVYPPDAQAAKVSGVVIIEVLIDAQGNVSEARVLRSVPLLDQAAVDAVKQWKFTPTIVGGTAVPIVMTVTVRFTLAQVK
jgi:protein TonB